MKTSLLSGLGLLCLMAILPTSGLQAQTAVYSEAPVVAKSGYWSLLTDPKRQDYTLVRFYNDGHELVYQERLDGIYLNPLKNRATHRRISQMLGTALEQVQRAQSNSAISGSLVALKRQTLRLYAVR
ncbi:hypothetical protein K3G63_06480 [Hymenobacter sp. HSC-4F20]|uniref:hypothetical protein n=1 Tax=Hymenobacter sp. HSC-4F20 TaxID=2864135 RepID=UPI001C72C310|nr:hypothetical protein [Hymenobacter sp. HSC-4F20]MBX0290076.1 hypothetical protein [Hymenobacter sp. HSC-4F20]